MLEKYAEDNGFTNLKFLYDDGYSGTNFNRPAWKEVMELVESDQVSTLIVKDMPRLCTRPPYGYRKSEDIPSRSSPTSKQRTLYGIFSGFAPRAEAQSDRQATESGTGSDAHQLLLPSDRRGAGKSRYHKDI